MNYFWHLFFFFRSFLHFFLHQIFLYVLQALISSSYAFLSLRMQINEIFCMYEIYNVIFHDVISLLCLFVLFLIEYILKVMWVFHLPINFSYSLIEGGNRRFYTFLMFFFKLWYIRESSYWHLNSDFLDFLVSTNFRDISRHLENLTEMCNF